MHTKGPWHHVGNGDIWEAPEHGKTAHFIGHVETIGDPEERRANANLVAAAPELLEALEMLFNIATHPKATRKQILMIAQEARAALAAAKGE